MDNHTRRVGYVAQNRRCSREEASAIVAASYADGSTAGLLRAGQRRRVARGKAKGVVVGDRAAGTHFRRQRVRRAEQFRRRLERLGLA